MKSKKSKSNMTACSADAKYTGVHPVLKVYFGYCFNKAALKYKSMLAKELDPQGLVGPQLGLLKLIEVQGPISQIALTQDTGIDKATMVKFIDDLEKRRWVRRIPDTHDRRIKLVEMTNKGKEASRKLLALHNNVAQEFLAPLSKSEQEILQKLVSRLT